MTVDTPTAQAETIETAALKRFVFAMSGSAAATALRRAAKGFYPDMELMTELPPNKLGRQPTAAFFVKYPVKTDSGGTFALEMFDVATVDARKAKVGNSLMDAIEHGGGGVTPYLVFHVSNDNRDVEKVREEAHLLCDAAEGASIALKGRGKVGVLVGTIDINNQERGVEKWDVISWEEYFSGLAHPTAAGAVHPAVLPIQIAHELENSVD